MHCEPNRRFRLCGFATKLADVRTIAIENYNTAVSVAVTLLLNLFMGREAAWHAYQDIGNRSVSMAVIALLIGRRIKNSVLLDRSGY
jgi:hypothetical protein